MCRPAADHDAAAGSRTPAEPVTPGPDRLIGHVDTTFEHQLLHVAEAQWKPVVQPDAMADDLGWKPEPFIRRACSGHDRRSCPTSPSRLTNLTEAIKGCLGWCGSVMHQALHHVVINIGEKRADHVFDLVESLGSKEHRLVVRDVVFLNTHPADVQRPEFGVFDLLDLPV